jgi:hypothetical protein
VGVEPRLAQTTIVTAHITVTECTATHQLDHLHLKIYFEAVAKVEQHHHQMSYQVLSKYCSSAAGQLLNP